MVVLRFAMTSTMEIFHIQLESILEIGFSILNIEDEGALAGTTGPELDDFIQFVEEVDPLLMGEVCGAHCHFS